MTFSIVARDQVTGKLGIAIATKHLAVGALCCHTQSGVGAVATQAATNPLLGIQGLQHLAAGFNVTDTLEQLKQSDMAWAQRQIHLIDWHGANVAWTGDACIDWAGHQVFEGFSIAGNMLAGAGVLEAMAVTYQTGIGVPFAQRLLDAMSAGEAAGGDKRGRQSAALVIIGNELYRDLDLRVDDHTDPIPELLRLYQESQKDYYQDFRKMMPGRDKLN